MTINVVLAEGSKEASATLAAIIENDPNMSPRSQAFTGLECISLVMRYRPDVLILSSYLQDMDLKSIIGRIMRQMPTPTLLLFTDEDHELVSEIKKLDIGIIDYLQISRSGQRIVINDISLTTRIHILSKLKIEKFKAKIQQGIQQTRNRQKTTQLRSRLREIKESSQSVTNTQPEPYSGRGRSSRIVVIGTSTGGPRLLSELIPRFPANLPPVVIVQHMPVGFISAFARRLNRLAKIRVREAKSGDSIMAGNVYLAPGGKHLEFHQIGGGIPKVLLTDGPPVNFVKPAVDVTLRSASKVYGSGVISVILTGMGSDGREGSRMVKDNHGIVLALNEEDSDIYGMNRAVIEAGLADEIYSKKDVVMGIIRAIEGKL